MGRIVLYKGQSQYDVLRIFIDQLAEAFTGLREEVIVVDLLASDVEEQLKSAFSKPCDFVFSFNGMAVDLKLGDNSLYDALNTIFVFSLVDDPMYHLQRLETPCNNMLVTCVDRFHTNFMPYLNQYRTFGFLPHGGCLSKTPQEEKRDLDIIFSGSFRNPNEYYQSWKNYPLALKKMLVEIVENALDNNNRPLEYAVQEVISKRDLYLDRALTRNLFKILPQADQFVRMKRRMDCLEVLAKAGMRIKVFGNGWTNAPFADQLEIHKAINFKELLKLITRTKIVLNIVPSFSNGSHERVFSAMLNGAVALTDRNKYFETEFKEDLNIVMYSWNNLAELPDKIHNLLQDQENLISIAQEGYKVAVKNHTWTARALAILEMVENFRCLQKI